MKVVTVYKNNHYGWVGYKYQGKIYSFGEGHSSISSAEDVVKPFGYKATNFPKDWTYTGIRYIFKD